MKAKHTVLLALTYTALLVGNARPQGDLTPPGAPSPSMKTLEQVEPRMPISSAPYNITQSGSYYLTSNILVEAGVSGISVNAHDVTIDMMGFTISGPGTGSLHGIFQSSGYRNLRINNGKIVNFPSSGSAGISANGRHTQINHVQVSGNYYGIYCDKEDAMISDCQVFDNSFYGIRIHSDSIIARCSTRNNQHGIMVYSDGVNIMECDSSHNTAYGIYLNGKEAIIKGCSISYNSSYGIYLNGEGSSVKDSSISHNNKGIYAANAASIADCTLANNTQYAIRISSGSVVKNNTFTGNDTGIETTSTGSNNRIEANQVVGNSKGIEIASTGNYVADNNVQDNTTDYDIAEGNHLRGLFGEELAIEDTVQQLSSTVQQLQAKISVVESQSSLSQELILDLARAQGLTVSSNWWNTTTVDSVGQVGDFTSLAFTPAGQPAISYFDITNDDLKYAEYDSISWSLTTVDSIDNVGWFTSLAFTPSGQPAISYYDNTYFDLKFAEYKGSSWILTTVDSVGSVGSHTSLAFNPSGYPAISYYSETNNALKYAEFNGSSWNVSRVDDTADVGWYTDLAFTSSGYPAISYWDRANWNLKYAEYNGSGWDLTTVDNGGNVGRYSSLAFTPAGQPAISYFDSTNDDLKYAEYNGSTWGLTTVDSVGALGDCTSLVFTPSGHPAISYYHYTDISLKYAEYNGSTWDLTTVDTGGGTDASLAFTPAGHPAISYNYANSDLKYAEFKDEVFISP